LFHETTDEHARLDILLEDSYTLETVHNNIISICIPGRLAITALTSITFH
jgi:hypothetical protein